jgi:mannose-1-phosphate guanylyltransferase
MQPNRNRRDNIVEIHKNPSANPVGCALVLAGGEGKRLRPFVHLLRRDLLPKQYVNFIGRRSMLEHTLDRAERLLPRERVYTVINRGHLIFPEVRRQVAPRQPGTVIVQPENKETAPGILFSLVHIAKRHPDSIVTLLPSDHFILEEEELLAQVSVAQQWVRRDNARIVLLGVRPDRDESEYGYIIPGCRSKRGSHTSFQIASFVEKPDDRAAQALARDGALWNTMMMVFKTDTIMNLIEETAPQLFQVFRKIHDA